MATERKTERIGPVSMWDEERTLYSVYCEVKSQRTQYMDGTWDKWQQESKRFFTDTSPVNPADADGWWEVVATGVRIRP